MKRLSRLPAGLVGAALLAFAAACADGGNSTGPTTDEHPAIPQFAAAACAVWSCQIGQCQQDPALYGACCIQAATAEYPATSKPSCNAPGGGGGASYCDSGNSFATCLDKAYDQGTSTQACTQAPYVDGDGFAYNPGTAGYNTAFPECS